MSKEKHSLEEAITLVKDNAKANFDETVEVHFTLNIDVTKPNQTIRVSTILPHGTGKKVKVAVISSKKVAEADIHLSEVDITKLEKGKIKPNVDFDVLIVEPKTMSKLAKLGPILGPAGVMPNPKAGTVTENIKDAVLQFKKGKLEIKNEPDSPLIHTYIGKVSFDKNKLIENFVEILTTLKQNKPQKAKVDWLKKCYICSTMGAALEVDFQSL